MSMNYTFKCIEPDGSQFCHPCEGAYRIIHVKSKFDQSTSAPSLASEVIDVEKGVHVSTDDYVAIYIENASGKTINQVHSPHRTEEKGWSGQVG